MIIILCVESDDDDGIIILWIFFICTFAHGGGQRRRCFGSSHYQTFTTPTQICQLSKVRSLKAPLWRVAASNTATESPITLFQAPWLSHCTVWWWSSVHWDGGADGSSALTSSAAGLSLRFWCVSDTPLPGDAGNIASHPHLVFIHRSPSHLCSILVSPIPKILTIISYFSFIHPSFFLGIM